MSGNASYFVLRLVAVMSKDQPCLFKFLQYVPSLCGKNFETPFFVRLDHSNFQYNLGKFSNSGIIG